MKVTTYNKIKKILALILALFLLIAFYLHSALVTLLVLLSFMFLTSLLKTRVDGQLADERQVQVSEKAAQVSFQLLLPILLLTSLVLVFSSGEHDFYYLKALGTIFSYVTSLALLIYLASYWYFDKKTGGK